MQNLFRRWKGWAESLRRTHPIAWHLNTVAVLTFSVAASVLAFGAAALVTVDDKVITPIEPVFFTLLLAGFILCTWWMRRLLRPLWPAQSSTSRSEPSLSACIAHIILFIAPAFLFGAMLHHRIVTNQVLTDAVIWSRILSAHTGMRYGESILALSGFRKELENVPDLTTAFVSKIVSSEDKNRLQELERIVKIIKEKLVSDLSPALSPPNILYFAPSSAERVPALASDSNFLISLAFKGSSSSAPPSGAAELMKARGSRSLLAAMDAWSWCTTAVSLLQLSNIPYSEPSNANNVRYEPSAWISRVDKRPMSAGASESLKTLFDSYLQGLKIVQASDIKTSRGYSSLEFVNPTQSPGVLSCATEANDRGFLLSKVDLNDAASSKFPEANKSYDRIVTQIVSQHVSTPALLTSDVQLMRLYPISEEQKLLAKALSDKFERDVSLVWAARLYFDSIIYAFTGSSSPSRGFERGFPFSGDWVWFGSWFALCAFLFWGATASFIILCYRIAPTKLRVVASWILWTLTASLVLLAMRNSDYVAITCIVVGLAGVACCIWACAKDRVVVAHKVACLVAGGVVPAIAVALPISFLQHCFSQGLDVTCYAFGTSLGDVRLTYMAGAILVVIILGELFLFGWCRIAAKPS